MKRLEATCSTFVISLEILLKFFFMCVLCTEIVTAILLDRRAWPAGDGSLITGGEISKRGET